MTEPGSFESNFNAVFENAMNHYLEVIKSLENVSMTFQNTDLNQVVQKLTDLLKANKIEACLNLNHIYVP